ncbi:hypothetical protein N5T78_06655 [Aliarcobacter cryaerophilus]|uniref:hypothetical protein n=1 Tax=Aliarcobacter cryaerophilus TaxID=28198 RepID=UPI0021B577E7|nr:hypothetical protein [Aliarcobacter cryaerophilus]MCT7466253.1 hypothetical protein [Aliarcobacter cryaerophilus]
MKRYLATMLIFITFIFTGCGVSQEDYNKLNSEYQKLIKDNELIKKELDELKNGEARLVGKIEKANTEKKYSDSVKYINELYERFPESSKNKEYQQLLSQFNIEIQKEKELIAKKELEEKERKEKEEKERIRLENLNNTGMWEVKYYVDQFGEPTKNYYITNKNPINGYFSNSATRNSELKVEFLNDEYDVAIQLYEYAGNNPVKAYSSEDYTIYVKDKDGETYILDGWMGTGSDRLIFSNIPSKASNKIVKNVLMKGGTIQFRIVENKYGLSKYSFTLTNADWYDNAYNLLKVKNNEK